MSGAPLDVLPLEALFCVAGLLLLLAVETGYRFGRWRHSKWPDERDQPVGSMVGSILGLLALMLAFTFSLAASRFEARRETLLEEANAIGTAFLRAGLLSEPERGRTKDLLREYVGVRIRGDAVRTVSEAVVRSEAIHEALWAQVSAAAEKNPNSIMTGVYVQSLNNLIDLHAKRVMVGLRSRIPLVIWGGLFGVGLLAMAAVGYQAGLSMTRRTPAMLGLVMAFSVVLLLIADLDRAHEGTLQVSQQALIDVQRTMQPADVDRRMNE
jgi:hypothetical protein